MKTIVIIAKLDSASRKKQLHENCKSVICCITPFDSSVTWVQCDNCDKWVHTLFECFTPIEELSINTAKNYTCLHCRDVEKADLVAILKTKIAGSLSEEDALQLEIVDLGKNCDELKAKVACGMEVGRKF